MQREREKESNKKRVLYLSIHLSPDALVRNFLLHTWMGFTINLANDASIKMQVSWNWNQWCSDSNEIMLPKKHWHINTILIYIVYTYIYICMYVYNVYIYMCVYVCNVCIHIYIYVDIYIYIYIYVDIYIYICRYVCIYIHTYVYIYIYYVYIYIYYVYIYIYIYYV